MLREVAEALVFALVISCHQLRGSELSSLRLVLVVLLVLSCLEVNVLLWRMHQRALEWRRLSLRRRPSSRQRRQSNYTFNAPVALAPRCHQGLRHRDVALIHLLDHRVCL